MLKMNVMQPSCGCVKDYAKILIINGYDMCRDGKGGIKRRISPISFVFSTNFAEYCITVVIDCAALSRDWMRSGDTLFYRLIKLQ